MDIKSGFTLVVGGFLAMLLLPIVSVRAAADAPSPNLMAEYPIDKWCEVIMVPVVWKDKPACFILDTGASISVVDSKAFPDLKVEDEKATVGTSAGQRAVEFCYPPDLRVGPFMLNRCGPVARIDLSNWREVTGRPVIGVLGVSAVDDFVVQIDFDDRKLRFLRPDFKDHPQWGKPTPMQIGTDPKTPVVQLVVGGPDVTVQVDTGSGSFADLPTPAFERLLQTSKQPVGSIPTATEGGNVQLRSVREGTADIAAELFRNCVFSETKSADGAVGLDFLERHLATLDFPGHCIYLKPGKEFDHRSEENMCGLRFGKIGPDLVAKFVDVGSVAERAGCKQGDVLTELNGVAAKDWDIYDVRALFKSEEGKEIKVKFRRDSLEKTATFKLHRAI